jgi:hypothetical protein
MVSPFGSANILASVVAAWNSIALLNAAAVFFASDRLTKRHEEA